MPVSASSGRQAVTPALLVGVRERGFAHPGAVFPCLHAIGEAIGIRLDLAHVVAYQRERAGVAASAVTTMVYGTTPDYVVVRDWSLASGGFFSEADVRSAARVVVIGAVVARELFGDEDPVGKIIRIRQAPFDRAPCSCSACIAPARPPWPGRSAAPAWPWAIA